MLVTERATAAGPARAARVAVRSPGGELTYAALARDAATIGARSGRWSDHGDERSPFAGLLADGSPRFLAAFLGLAARGWAVGVLDPSWTRAELQAAVTQLDPAVLVVDEQYAARVPAGWTSCDVVEGWHAYAREPPDDPRPPPPATPDGAFYVGFTSGSSGRPKAFVRSHRSWWESFRGFTDTCPLPPGVVVIPGPLSSSHFLFGALHALHEGATVDLTPTGTLAARLAAVDAAALYVVPAMLAQLVASAAAHHKPPAYVFCAGARLDPALRAEAERRLPGSALVEYYGASELSFVAISVPGDASAPGSVGRAFPGVAIAIRDDDGNDLPAGAHGTIYARSPLVFSGYRGRTPASAARSDGGGWWTVGDRGHLRADGSLFVAGRGSSLIIRGGANIQPEEVEEVLAAARGVHGVVVVGVSDPRWGQIVCAAVVADAGVTRARLREELRQLSAVKRPRRFVRLEEIPLGRTGKPDRQRVQSMVQAGLLQEIR